MSAFADQKLAPNGFSGFLSFGSRSAVQVFEVCSLEVHNSLYPFKFFHGDNRFVPSLHLGEVDFTIVFDLFLFQIVRRVLLVGTL